MTWVEYQDVPSQLLLVEAGGKNTIPLVLYEVKPLKANTSVYVLVVLYKPSKAHNYYTKKI